MQTNAHMYYHMIFFGLVYDNNKIQTGQVKIQIKFGWQKRANTITNIFGLKKVTYKYEYIWLTKKGEYKNQYK